MSQRTEPSETPAETVGSVLRESFPGKRFRRDHLFQAGKLLRNQGREAVIEFLQDKVGAPNFKPPAKCSIVGVSRPLVEWPIYKASQAIQQYIYGLTVDERKATKPGTSKQSHTEWFAQTGVDTHGYRTENNGQVQGLNLIFQHALSIYDGVLKKVENRNRKLLDKVARINASRRAKGLPESGDKVAEVESATTEDGHLLHPPGSNEESKGINRSVYCYDQVSPEPFNSNRHDIDIPFVVTRDSDAVIPHGMPDRLTIPQGEPGYVPEHDRAKLTGNKHKRIRAPYALNKHKPKPGRTSTFDPKRLAEANAQHAILGIICIDQDWVVFDMRGLVRNMRWRDLVPKEGITPRQVLSNFTGDPVIDPQQGIITFVYKADVAAVRSVKVTTGSRTKDILVQLATADGGYQEVGVISVDLGQTNPVAAGIYRIRYQADQETLVPTCLQRTFLPEDSLEALGHYRRAHDAMEDDMREMACRALTPEQQAEIENLNKMSSARTKVALEALGVDLAAIPWSEVTSHSSFISDYLLAHGGNTADVWYEVPPKKTAKPTKKPHAAKIVKRWDAGWVKLLRPKLSEETRRAFNDQLWELKRTHAGYQKLATRKRELARQVVNSLLQQTKKLTQCEHVAVVIEDLNVGFFHGKGKRVTGWDAFFQPKTENRWFIQALHGALTDVAQHRGINVLEVNPARTSMTCTECGHCDGANRSEQNRERFVCVRCGVTRHADLEIATDNILRVALTGASMPKGEQSGDVQNPRSSRKRKPAKLKTNQEVLAAQAAEQTTTHEPLAKHSVSAGDH